MTTALDEKPAVPVGTVTMNLNVVIDVTPFAALSTSIEKALSGTELLQKYMTEAVQAQVGYDGFGRRVNVKPRHQLPDRRLLTPQLVEDLEGAARVMRRDGWVAGTWFAHDGRVCTEGALIRHIAGRDVRDWSMLDVAGPHLQRRFENAKHALAQWIGCPPAVWNDHVVREGAQAIEELERLAFEVERALMLAPRWDASSVRCAPLDVRQLTFTP
jgi:hypothetical protein